MISDILTASAPQLEVVAGIGMDARDTGVNNLELSVRDLAAYAKTGERLDAPVEEYLVSIAPPVWMRAYDSGVFRTDEFDKYDPDDPDGLKKDWRGQLMLVMRCAIARQSLDRGEPVSPADVAALASMAAAVVRILCSEGKVDARKVGKVWEIPAEEARRFIAQQEAKRVRAEELP